MSLIYEDLFSGAVRELPRFSALARVILGQAEELISLVPSLQAAFLLMLLKGYSWI